MYVCMRLKFLHRHDHISISTAWLMFLMNRALHFATRLNSRDIQKFNCFWVPSDDLFASARKAVFPEPTPTGVHRLKNTLSSQSVRSNLPQKNFNSPLWTKVWTPYIKNSWICLWIQWCCRIRSRINRRADKYCVGIFKKGVCLAL